MFGRGYCTDIRRFSYNKSGDEFTLNSPLLPNTPPALLWWTLVLRLRASTSTRRAQQPKQWVPLQRGASLRSPNRSWGGFGNSQALNTPNMVLLSVPFSIPLPPQTASLTVWARMVQPNTMHHSLILGRDSFMQFKSRTDAVLLARPPHNNRVLGKYTRELHDIICGVAEFVPS